MVSGDTLTKMGFSSFLTIRKENIGTNLYAKEHTLSYLCNVLNKTSIFN